MIERKTFINFGENQDHSIDYLLGIMTDARTTTLQRIETLTKEELHWQYSEGWNTIGVLLSHFISIDHFFRIVFVEGRNLTEEEEKKYRPGMEMGKFIPQLINNHGVEHYISELEISQKKFFDEIKKLDKYSFFKKREGYNPNTGHNLAWTLYHAAEDEVHHRGQISILRKLYKQAHS